MNQLSLLPPPPKPEYAPHPSVVVVVAAAQVQEKKAVAIARSLGLECDRTRDLVTPDFIRVWNEYYERFPDEKPQSVERAAAPRSRTAKAYIPWSLERKQRNRARLMNERLRKKYSLPELLIPVIQATVIANPWYYGCCPLPAAGASFPANIPNPKYLAAIAKEQELRGICK